MTDMFDRGAGGGGGTGERKEVVRTLCLRQTPYGDFFPRGGRMNSERRDWDRGRGPAVSVCSFPTVPSAVLLHRAVTVSAAGGGKKGEDRLSLDTTSGLGNVAYPAPWAQAR